MKRNINLLLLWVFILTYLLCFSLVSIMKFNAYGYHDFDLAVHDLSMQNILHGSIFNSILGIPFLGNHMHIILFFIAPIYALFRHPLTLLLLQTIVLGMTALALYKIASSLLDENWALIISIIYLFYPALGYTNLFEFHPTVFATLLLTLTFYFYERNSFIKFIFFAVLSMLCQENIPLAIMMFGILAIFNHKSLKWIIIPISMACLYFFVALTLINHFNNNTVQFFSLYAHLGNTPREIVLNAITKPILLFKILFRKQCGIYLLSIFSPLAFIPLLQPLGLIPALPFFLQHLLSIRYTELTIYYHYAAEIIPFIFISFIYAIRFLSNKLVKREEALLKILLLLVVIVSNVYMGPGFKLPSLMNTYRKDYLDKTKDDFIAKIPAKTPVVATFEFLSHLSGRRSLYSFHHVYMGFHTLSNKIYVLPDNVKYALLDFNDFLTFRGFYGPNQYINLQKFLLGGHWQVEELTDTIVVFKKDSGLPKYELCQLIKSPSREIENKTQVKVEDDIELIGFNMRTAEAENLLEIVFYWECLRPTKKDINIFLDFLDMNDNLLVRKIRPICYRIFPTNSWRKGQIFREGCRIKIPDNILRSKYKLKMGFFDFRNDLLCMVKGTSDSSGRVFITQTK